MSDSLFKFSLSLLFWLVLALCATGIVLGAMGLPWLNADQPALVLITLLLGLAVLILGGGALIYVWGKRYMSKG
jgi:hypothetical protein